MDKPNLETDGFTWVSGRHTIDQDFGYQQVQNRYKADLEDDSIRIVKDLTGSKLAISFASVYRDQYSSGSRRTIPAIHSDLSSEGVKFSERELQKKLLESKDPDQLEFGKKLKKGNDVAIYKVWRPLLPVQDNHFGISKWDSILEEDAIELDQKIKPTNPSNSFQAWKYREGQSWYFVPHQAPDEAFVFKINVPHASFTLEGEHGKQPTMISFETRIMTIVDSPSKEGMISKFDRKFKSLVNQFNWNT
ncbi:uncharacterized protein MELLADRAFT_64153 [Melampsora larici-populina 98AG31]|uniref:Uncharacterized protein n=1 Tax=Melampsora larici-populina (strain 98AG31 / pathotype 3-4-7) TaxID=747676 RepID=F4RQ76_MELLP|nr:uncharacterized protein MELLADRAFT_64153 [Melampsora larici-populina 98AG31]EGG05452.1 hypothetical protein MELLADRAFT_64153 [Melampsora larici-populina 98AG31]